MSEDIEVEPLPPVEDVVEEEVVEEEVVEEEL